MQFSKKSMGLVGLFILAASAMAGVEPWIQGPCAEDAKKFCGEVISKGGNVGECMKSHQEMFSPACNVTREERRVEMMGMMGAMMELRKACAADLQKLCKKPTPPKKGQMPGPQGCLREHYSELSADCRTKVDAVKTRPPVRPMGRPTPGATHSTSLEQESSDLAEAVLRPRRFRLGESLSPSERTMTLASAATSEPKKESKKETSKN